MRGAVVEALRPKDPRDQRVLHLGSVTFPLGCTDGRGFGGLTVLEEGNGILVQCLCTTLGKIWSKDAPVCSLSGVRRFLSKLG